MEIGIIQKKKKSFQAYGSGVFCEEYFTAGRLIN